MRLPQLLLAGAFLTGLTTAACNTSNDPPAAATTPTPTPTITVQQLLVDIPDLPKECTKQDAGPAYHSIFQDFVARSFDCAEVRLTNAVGFLKSEEEAKLWQSDHWSTRDAVTDLIKPSVLARPTDQSSLRIEDVTQTLPRLGADEEKLYCATFTDPSGTQRVTEYWGGFRHKNVVVQYTASALTSGGCDSASGAPTMARMLATAQLGKLKAGVK